MTYLLLLVLPVALAASATAGWVFGRRALKPVEKRSRPQPIEAPGALPELGWILRAHGAYGVWLRRPKGALVEIVEEALPLEARRTIGAKIGNMPAKGSGSNVERMDEGNFLYVSTEDLLVGMLVPSDVPTAPIIRDLEALIAALRARAMAEVSSSRPLSPGETVESVAIRLALEVERLLDTEVAVAVRRPRGAQVMGTAVRADPHLQRVTAPPGSPVDLCIRGETDGAVLAYEPFGLLPWDRRHRERKALVMPVRSDEETFGALVIWPMGVADPVGPNRADLEKMLLRTGRLLDDAVNRLELSEQAAKDPLTGLANRRGLEAAMTKTGIDTGALICIDLDHFKNLNDNLGHPAGDAALGFVSRVILDTIRDQDSAARVGGEEFAVWLPNTSSEEAVKVAERLRTRIAGRAWGWQGKPWPITASLGVACWPESTSSRDNLLGLADQSLYRAKQAGRNRVEIWKA